MVLIHQIYLDFGNHYWCDVFSQSKKSWDYFYGYTFWDIDKINKFLIDYPLYKPLWDKIDKPICKVDYIRICILIELGGLYIDLDVINTCGHLSWIQGDNFFHKVDFGEKNGGKQISNDIIYLNRPKHLIFDKIIEYFNKNFDRLEKMTVYKNRIMRYIQQSFGPASFKRYLTVMDKIKLINFLDVSFLSKNGDILKNIKNSPITIHYQNSWICENNGFNPKNKSKYKNWIK